MKKLLQVKPYSNHRVLHHNCENYLCKDCGRDLEGLAYDYREGEEKRSINGIFWTCEEYDKKA